MKLLKIEKSFRAEKRFVAIFQKEDGKLKKVHFGLRNPKLGTYIDHKDKKLRKNYRARHERDLRTEKNNQGLGSGALSYYLLWGDSTNLQTNIKEYKKRFNL